MKTKNKSTTRRLLPIVAATVIALMIAAPAMAGEYAALDGVNQIRVVFDVSQGSPQIANVVFWAVRNVYDDASVRALSKPPQVAVVFHGPAVRMISTDREGFGESDNAALDKFADTIRQMKKEGVKLEVCGYALKVLDVDPATILPEVDRVGNGFISIAGYQAQGYAVITIN
jgi:uncharacterized protein